MTIHSIVSYNECSSLPERNILNITRYSVMLSASLYVTLACDDGLVLTTNIQATKYRGDRGGINTWAGGRLSSSCYHFMQHCMLGYSAKNNDGTSCIIAPSRN